MGKPITHEYGQEKGILKFFPYQGAACVVPQSMANTTVGTASFVLAGTPFPSNDGKALGVLLHDVDVTQGDAAGTYVYEGTIDPDKLEEKGVTISDAAKKAMPNVRIYGEAYKG